MEIKYKLPEYVEFAIERLRASGFEVYVVGGCVRDMIMGKVPNDYDMTTNALPQQTAECFSDLHVIETGLKHGTVTVVVDRHPLEITTFRHDGEYDDNRHPKNVTFTKNIRDDLSRRDFTVNAMAYSHETGIVDAFGGIEDIKRGIIRCVGDPDTRFSEDGLRIMRALRFSATLGFEIDEKTADSIHRNRELLKNISAERIKDEFSKLICGQGATAVLREFYDVIGVFIPEILPCVGFEQNTKYHDRDVFEHTLSVIDACPHFDRALRLSAIFHDISKPECYTEDERGGHFYGHAQKGAEAVSEIMGRLKFDNDMKKKVRRLVSEHMTPVEPTERSVRRFISAHDDESAGRALMLAIADRLSCAPEFADISVFSEIKEIRDRLKEEEDRISLKTLAVHGGDLIKLGFSGKEIGQCLDFLLSQVLDGELPNEKDALIAAAKQKK